MADLGRTRRFTADFTSAGSAMDPTTVVLTVTNPLGVVTTPTPINPTAGQFYADIVLDVVGVWTIGWQGTGSVPVSASEQVQVVDPAHSGPANGPLPWILWSDVEAVGTPADLPPAVQDIVLATASDLMWQMSGRQFGLWAQRARPIPFCGHCYTWAPVWWGYPGWAAPSAQNWVPCSCNYYPYVHLGRAPIASIEQVIVDGMVVDPSEYRVDEFNYLVRIGPNDDPPVPGWPICSNLTDSNDHAGVFEVAWTYGNAVPVAGKTAAALLAIRISYEVAEDLACAIPVNSSSVTAEGVTIRLDTTAMAEQGRTGMLIPDLWLNVVCPHGPQTVGGGFDPGGRREFWRVGT